MLPIALLQPPKLSPRCLAAALDRLDWDPARRGVLLLVDPARIFPRSKAALLELMGMVDDETVTKRVREPLRPPPLPAPGASGYSIDRLAAHFDRRVVQIGSVTTLARIDQIDPAWVAALERAEAGEGDPVGDANSQTLALLGTLTRAQWSAAGSPRGLARESMTARQVGLFDALIPDTANFTAPPGRLTPLPRRPSDADLERFFATGEAGPSLVVPTLPAGQLSQLRLRMVRDLSLIATATLPSVAADKARGVSYDLDPDEPPTVAAQIRLRSGTLRGDWQTDRLGIQFKPPRVRVVAKASDIDTNAAALQAPVPLSGVASVGELVERIARETRAPLYVDARYEALPVTVRGDSAPAGALLAALCRALELAGRVVADSADRAYLLTRERAPGPGRSAEALARVEADVVLRNRAAAVDGAHGIAAIGALDPLTLVGRGVGADVPDALWKASETGDERARFPIVTLPERYRSYAKAQWDALNDEIKSTQVAPTEVSANAHLRVELYWPDRDAASSLARFAVGELRAQPASPEPPVLWPAAARVRGVSVPLPESAADAKRLIDAALARAVTHLFVTGDRQSALAEVAAQAKAAGLAVIATLAPLTAASGDPDDARDLSPNGQTVRQWADSPLARELSRRHPSAAALIALQRDADFLAPERVDATKVAAQVGRLAALPGVAAVGLRELEPPGYAPDQSQSQPWLWRGGFTPAARLRFVRTRHFDPADLGVSESDEVSLRLHDRFRNDWGEFQGVRVGALAARIDAALKARSVSVPILGQSDALTDGAFWADWTGKRLVLDGDAEQAPPVPRPKLALRHLDPREYASFDLHDDDAATTLLQTEVERRRSWVRGVLSDLETQPGETPRYHGAVLELGHLPFVAALAALETTLAVQKALPPLSAVAPKKP